jgi:hypothetical protein
MASQNIPPGIGGFHCPMCDACMVLTLIDMNDESNLDLYSQLLLLKNNTLRDEVLWHYPEYKLRRTLLSLAQKLDLEYEYSLATRIVRISRPTSQNTQMDLETPSFEFLDLQYPQGGGGFSSSGFSVADSHLYGSLDVELPVPRCQPDTRFNTPTTALETSVIVSDLSNWLNLESNSFSNIGAEIPATEGQPQPLDSAINNLSPGLHAPGQFSQSHGPVSPAMKSIESSFKAQMSPDCLVNALSVGSQLQNEQLPTSGLPPKALNGMVSTLATNKGPTYDADADDSDDSVKPSKRERRPFYCTDFPPCKHSFARSEHLARHIR